MNDDPIKMQRVDLKIGGDRNLYSYTFLDEQGRVIPADPMRHEEPRKAEPGTDDKAGGNLNSQQGENRPG